MSRVIAALLLLLAIPLPSFSDDPPTPSALAIRIRLPGPKTPQVLSRREEFDLILTNTSNQPLRIWKPYSRIAIKAISFQFKNTRSGQIHDVHIRPDIDPRYWQSSEHENPESELSTVEIGPHDSYVTRVQFSRGFWLDHGWINLPYSHGQNPYEIVATFESTKGKDASGHKVWTGKTRSPSVTSSYTGALPQDPFDAMLSGYEEEAIKLLAADPRKWISKTDSEGDSILHDAVHEGHVAIVKWLLDHGANTRLEGQNHATPIDLARKPEIIELILKKDPDLVRDKESHLQRLLHEAARNFATWSNKYEQENWNRIVQVYLDNGLENDLLVAIYRDDLKKVKQILEAHPDQAKSFDHVTPLRAAVSAGRLEICRHLLENFEVDVNDWEGGQGFPIILSALEHPEIVKLLIEHGADLKTRITLGSHGGGGFSGPPPFVGAEATVLHHAAEKGTPETIQLLLEHDLNIFATANSDFDYSDSNHRGNPHQFALEIAAEAGKGDNVKAIINHPNFLKSDPQIRQFILDKSLRIATSPHCIRPGNTQPTAIIPLLEKGANPNAKHKNLTLVQYAAETFNRREHPAIIAAFKKHGAILDLPTAAAIGDLDEVRNLIKKDPQSVNARNPNGDAPLHLAAWRGFNEIVATLLAAGADVNIRTKPLPEKKPGTEEEEETPEEDQREGDQTPLHLAVRAERWEVVQSLLQAGADVNAVSASAEAPLHLAAWNQNIRIARLLLQKGAKLDLHRKFESSTPLQVYQEVAKYNDGPDLAQLFSEFQPSPAK